MTKLFRVNPHVLFLMHDKQRIIFLKLRVAEMLIIESWFLRLVFRLTWFIHK